MGEKVEKVSGSFLSGFNVSGTDVLPKINRRIDSLNNRVFLNSGNAQLTVAQVVKGYILHDTNAGDRTDTLPDATDFIAGFPNVYSLVNDGDSIEFCIVNDGTNTLTIAAGVDVTLLGNSVMGQGERRNVTVTRTNPTKVTAISVNPLANSAVNTASVTSISANSNQTYTAEQVAGGYITRGNAANRTDDTPTGTQLSDIPGMEIGSSIDLVVNSSSTGDVTIAAGVDVTLVGGPTINAGEIGVIRFTQVGSTTFKAVFLT
jgi:hypothetical protein